MSDEIMKLNYTSLIILDKSIDIMITLLCSRYETPNLCWVSCANNKGGYFVVVDTNLPHFEVLAYVLSHFDALTHAVFRVSSKVC